MLTHEKADKSFDETILELLDIATQIEYIFEKSQNIELKRLLLKFVFEKLTLNEGKLNYKLKFPFSEFVDNNILSEQVAKLHEPMQKQAEQGLQAKNNEYLQIGALGRNRTGTSLRTTDFKSAASTCSATSA